VFFVQRETKKRAKAYTDSRKTAKPLWEEDGKRRSLLDKYDEDEEEVLTLGGKGDIQASAVPRKVDITARLAAGAAAMMAATAPAPASDYLTQEEADALRRPKKKKERRLKKKTLTGEELAVLEADAAARGGFDLGSRQEREGRAAAKEVEEETARAEKRQRFDHALAKANYASLALRGEGNGADVDDDDDLYQSLTK
jgi:U4/U6.U5 tri-snRNP-associated protein 1